LPFVSEKEAGSMIRFNPQLTNRAIERILELSADAQIERRKTAKGTPEFHHLSGAIAAYGRGLELLVELQQREELYAMIGELDLPGSGSELVH
jgi:hypothetical protein